MKRVCKLLFPISPFLLLFIVFHYFNKENNLTEQFTISEPRNLPLEESFVAQKRRSVIFFNIKMWYVLSGREFCSSFFSFSPLSVFLQDHSESERMMQTETVLKKEGKWRKSDSIRNRQEQSGKIIPTKCLSISNCNKKCIKYRVLYALRENLLYKRIPNQQQVHFIFWTQVY